MELFHLNFHGRVALLIGCLNFISNDTFVMKFMKSRNQYDIKHDADIRKAHIMTISFILLNIII